MGILKEIEEELKNQVINFAYLHRIMLKHIVSENNDVMLVSYLYTQDHTQHSLASFPYLSPFSAL